MKAALAATLAALVVAPAASARPDPQVVALRHQVAALQASVAGLRAELRREENVHYCYFALDQDRFQVVFHTLSLITAAITGQGVPAWDQIPRFDDKGACAAVGVTRP